MLWELVWTSCVLVCAELKASGSLLSEAGTVSVSEWRKRKRSFGGEKGITDARLLY